MKCPQCGTELDSDALFCPECGTYIGEQTAEKTDAAQEQQVFEEPAAPAPEEIRQSSDFENLQQNTKQQPYTNPQPYANQQQYINNQPKKQTNPAIIVIIVLLSLLVVIGAVFAGYLIMGGSSFGARPTPSPSPTPVPTATPRPTPTMRPTPVPTIAPAVSGAVKNPTYKVFKSDAYGFSCSYPSHFEVYNDGGTLTLWTGRSSDGSAREIIVATPAGGTTVNSGFNSYVSSHNGEILYQTKGSDYYAVNISDGTTEYYKYCKFKNGNMYWFEFISPHREHEIYDAYINDIYNSIEIR